MREGKTEEARTLMEATAKEAPENVNVRVGLASVYFDVFAKALAEKDEAKYREYLAKCQEEALKAVELDPDDARAHNLLGIVAIYRGDIDASRQSFNIARQLDPLSWVYYLNIAELEVYMGKLSRARRNIELARKFRAPPGDVELVETLAAWKRGDLVEARDTFDDVALLEPERARTWNGATSIATFDDMAAHCCQLEFCGPYMKNACKRMDQEVAERKREIETVRKELELEAERSKRIQDVYRNRRDIEILVEDAESEASKDKAPAAPKGKTPAKK